MASTQKPTKGRFRQPSSKYREICDQCRGVGYYMPAWATHWDHAEECATCKGEGEVCQECGEPVPTTDPPTPHGCVGPADPADIMAITGYYSHLPRYEVDEVWTRNGKTYCSISERFRPFDCPPDAEIQRYELVERNVRGEDVETTRFTVVGHVNGVTGKTEWYDPDEQAYDGDR